MSNKEICEACSKFCPEAGKGLALQSLNSQYGEVINLSNYHRTSSELLQE